MRVFRTIPGLRSELALIGQNQKIALVPTMGSLHIGHSSLIKRALSENDLVIVSIFVNPLQFPPDEDLETYPRQLDQDCQLCEQLGVHLVFAPSTTSMGIKGNTQSHSLTTTILPPAAMKSVLCGRFRSGHFQGVATIVTKLFNIVQPTNAYFGEKDAQQLAIIRRLVEDLNLDVEIRACPIIREESGLAYSSRNQYLSAEQKEQAVVLYRSLQLAKQAFHNGERQANKLLEIVNHSLAEVPEVLVEYTELVHPKTLIPLTQINETGLLALAAYLGSTRLIDNIILRYRQPIIAIDGPAGAGKSTVTRQIAEFLGLVYLDTGAMYRAVTWLVMESNIAINDQAAIAELVSTINLEIIPVQFPNPTIVKINHQEVTEAIRTPEVTANVSTIAAHAVVRKELVKIQQRMGEKGGMVAEGRDIGTNVFPDAELKIFLTASAEERARRRLLELKNQGRIDIDFAQLKEDILHRDEQDSNRKIAPLKQAVDAIAINTDGLTIEQVTKQIITLYQKMYS